MFVFGKKKKLWIELNIFEYRKVWNFIYEELKFSPNVNPGFVSTEINPPAFVLPIPFRIYNMSALADIYEKSTDEDFDKEIIKIFDDMILTCMKSDNYVFALDWHHKCYRYYPKAQIRDIDNEFRRISFFPDGDYQFFLAADFSWGYLAHPWQEGIYAYGTRIVEYLDKNERNLFLNLYSKS